MKGEIEVVKGAPRRSLSFGPGRPVTIGRSKAADLQVMSGVVSRLHCQIQGDGKSWVLTDLDSRNGTWLSSERIKTRDLSDGSIFTLGKRVVLRFKIRPGAPARPAQPRRAEPRRPEPGPGPGVSAEADTDQEAGPPPESGFVTGLLNKDVGGVRIIERLPGTDAVRLRAHQPSLNRHVMLHAFDPETVGPDFKDRLMEEIRGVSRLLHPKILQIHDLIDYQGTQLVVTEYFEGQSLADFLEKQRFVKVPAALSISNQMAEALAYAEGQDQIADTLSARDIYINDENVAKLDFFRPPVRRSLDPVSLSYVAPEVIEGGGLRREGGRPAEGQRDAALRSAVYSLGAILYHMLAGIPPFEGNTQEEVMPRILKSKPPSLRRVNLKVSPALARVVERAMDKDPANRVDSFRTFQADLRKIIAPAI